MAERLSSKFHICPRSFASLPNVNFSDNLSADTPATWGGLFTKYKESLNQSGCWKFFFQLWNYTKYHYYLTCNSLTSNLQPANYKLHRLVHLYIGYSNSQLSFLRCSSISSWSCILIFSSSSISCLYPEGKEMRSLSDLDHVQLKYIGKTCSLTL